MKIFTLQRLGVGALLLAPLTPLAVSIGFLFPYTSGRNFFFRTLILIALTVWILLWIHKPEHYRPRSSLLSWTILVFVVVVGIATALASYPSLAFWSTLERMDGLVDVLFLVAFFFSALHLLDAKSWKVFFTISIGTALVVSAIALLQLADVLPTHQGALRIDATLGNPSFFAAYMLLSAGLALFLASGEMIRRWRFAYSMCACLFLFLAFASGTRSALVAFLAGLLIAGVAALLLRKEHRSLRHFGIVSLTALAFFSGLFLALRHTSFSSHPLMGRLLSISSSGSDAEARFLSWNMALKGVGERPFFGWGPEGFRMVFVKYYDPRLYGREQWFDRAHNEYLDWLVQAGGIGLFTYLMLWVGLVRAVWRRASAFSAWERIALSGMFAGYAAFNIFSFDTITASLIFFSFLAFVESRTHTSPQPPLKGGASENPPLREVSRRFWSGRRMFFSALVCMAAIFVFYFAIAKPAYAAYLVHEGLRSNSPDLDTRLTYFTRAISLNSFATPEAREMLAQFAVDVSEAPLNTASRAKIVLLVTEELSRQIEKSPGDPRYPLRMGVVLNTYREYARAVPFLEQAVALSSRKQPSLYELGTSYLNLGQFDAAVAVFKRAADLLPDRQDLESKRLYAVSLVYAGRFAESESYMQRIFRRPVLDHHLELLADAYRRVGNPAKESYVREILEKERTSK